MRVAINGKFGELKEGINVENVLLNYKIKPEGIVVELNQKIIKRDEWQKIVIKENDIIELISFVGGG
jgi:sulfur carrier protein